jgi:DNA mismatch repair ATPase MutL
MKKQVKKIIFILITSLLVIAPIGNNVGLSFNQTIITYAAKSSKKSSSSRKKKKTTTKKNTKKKSDSTKKKTTGQGTTKKSTTKKKSTTNNYSSSKKSSSTNNSNSKIYNYSAGANSTFINDSTTCYVSAYGECYHRYEKCSNMRTARKTTVGEAKKNRRKCSKCW